MTIPRDSSAAAVDSSAVDSGAVDSGGGHCGLIGVVPRGRAVDHEAVLHAGGHLHQGVGQLTERGARDQHLGPAVVDDVAGLGRREMGVDGGDVETRPHAGPDDLEIGRVVLEQDGEVVAPAQPAVVEHAGEPERPFVQLAVGDATTGATHDDGGPLGCRLREVRDIHRSPRPVAS